MSLDVYLTGESKDVECTCDCGNVHLRTETEDLYSANITHNLTQMADAAGIYMNLWRPDEIGITRAKQLITPLEDGLRKLKERPEFFETFNAKNGWGLYKHFVPFVEKYLEACKEHPEATIHVSR